MHMRHLRHGLTTVLLATVAFGCSSKSADHADGGGHGEAGTSDGKRLDAAVSEAGSRDSKSGIDAADRDVHGTDGIDGALRDSGKRDGLRDAADDVVEDPDLPPDTPPPQGTCANPVEISAAITRADFIVDPTGMDHVMDFPCAANGSDIVFKIQADERDIVYVDTFSATWNTAVFFSETCDAPQAPLGSDATACNDDACGTTQSQATAIVEYGYHYLIVSGVNGEVGPVTVHFLRSSVGNGPAVNLPAGSDTVTGTTDGIDSTRTCDTAGPKNSYWWATCPTDAGGAFHASTCNGADWDTFLILQDPEADNLSCLDDDQGCGMQSTLDATIAPGASLYVLTVTGGLLRSYGDYALSYARP